MKITRYFIHYWSRKERKWKRAFRMCLTYNEAHVNMELLEKSAKLKGKDTWFRVVAIKVSITSVKQLELNL